VYYQIFEDDKFAVFRNSKFYQVMGEDFVKVAFHAAHAVDPAAKLYINGKRCPGTYCM
jgi:endo-1,4-beta-xylanase